MKAILLIGVIFSAAAYAGDIPNSIIGGSLLQPHQLPQTQSLGNNCTANLIGPRVIITAAHCVSGKEGVFTLSETKQVKIQNLESNPAYKYGANLPHDFAFFADNAVGILEEEVTDRIPYTISQQLPKIGDQLLFAGIGRPKVGIRQYGYNEVALVSENGFSLSGEKNKVAGDGGDSGGATLVIDTEGRVELVGVNSTSSRERQQFGVPAYTLGVARVNNTVTIDFLRLYADKHKVEICGINKECGEVKLLP